MLKKIITISKYSVFSLALVLGVSSCTHTASAAFVYTTYDIPYVVTIAKLPPVANAGIDRPLTPTAQTVIPAGGATATDSDGTVVSTVWTQTVNISGATSTITGGTTLTPTFADVEVGDTFTLTVTDNDGLTGTDSMAIIPAIIEPPVDCTTNPTDPSCITGPVDCTLHPTDPSCVTPPSFCTLHPTDPSCVTPPSFCTLHPTDPRCLSGGGPKKQCGDGLDNEIPGDGLIDTADPSCHTDCRATNVKTYDPTLDNEAKKCTKPVYIEI